MSSVPVRKARTRGASRTQPSFACLDENPEQVGEQVADEVEQLGEETAVVLELVGKDRVDGAQDDNELVNQGDEDLDNAWDQLAQDDAEVNAELDKDA